MSAIGERLRAYRSGAGLSLRDLAALSGVAHGTISNWETGRRRPQVVELSAVCVALGVTVADVVDGGGPGEPMLPAQVRQESLPEVLRTLQQEITSLRAEVVALRHLVAERQRVRE